MNFYKKYFFYFVTSSLPDLGISLPGDEFIFTTVIKQKNFNYILQFLLAELCMFKNNIYIVQQKHDTGSDILFIQLCIY